MNRPGLTLERRWGEAQAKADEAGGEDERQEGESAKPTAVGEAADIGVVRLEAEGQAPAQRTEAVRPLDQHRNAAKLVAEAPGHALVVLLSDLGAVLDRSAMSPSPSAATSAIAVAAAMTKARATMRRRSRAGAVVRCMSQTMVTVAITVAAQDPRENDRKMPAATTASAATARTGARERPPIRLCRR